MLKKILIGLGILVVLGIAVIALAAYFIKPDKSKILTYLKENKSNTALKLVRNGTTLAERNSTEVMPLASTVKIIIAIEYAEQAAQGIVDPDEMVKLSELDKFYVKNTDGGAHPSWLKYVKKEIVDEQISIREIAKGMILMSSNANTEWLCKKLGLDNINNRLDSLGVKNHSEIYNIVSALFIGKELFPERTGEELATQLRALSTEEYIQATEQIHTKLLSSLSYKEDLGDLSMKIQRVWSDRLPAATVDDYVNVMAKINSRSFLSPEVHSYLDEVMEFLLENPKNREWLEHAGMKGGSTAFVLTKALYAEDKSGNKIELAYFIDDMSPLENTKLQMSMNAFELAILTDKTFRSKVVEAINN